MYNPKLGIFISHDPLGYIDSMNMYAYCGNNPTNFVDPWGLWAVMFGGSFSAGKGIGYTAGSGFYFGREPGHGWFNGLFKGWYGGTYQTGGNGIHTGGKLSITVDIGISTNAKKGEDLAGHAVEFGGSGGAGLGCGVTNTTASGENPTNVTTFSVGAVAGGEGHVYNTYTWTQENCGW